MRRHRQLGQTPSLLNADLTDDVRSPRAAEAVRTVDASGDGPGDGSSRRCGRERRVIDVGRVVRDLVLRRDCRRHAITELGGIAELVDTGDIATAADQAVEVVGRIVGPRRVELRDRLTHREPGELDERVVDADRIAACDAGIPTLIIKIVYLVS